MSEEKPVLFNMPVIEEERLVGKNADIVEREAYERGYQAGEKAGLEMGIQRGAAILEKMESVLKEIILLKSGLAKELEAQCLELCFSLARKLALSELSTNPENVVKIVKEALMRIERSGVVKIRIHPSLKDVFTRFRPGLLDIHADIAFEPDPSLPQYSAIVTSPTQEMAVDIDEQLKNLIKGMVERRVD